MVLRHNPCPKVSPRPNVGSCAKAGDRFSITWRWQRSSRCDGDDWLAVSPVDQHAAALAVAAPHLHGGAATGTDRRVAHHGGDAHVPCGGPSFRARGRRQRRPGSGRRDGQAARDPRQQGATGQVRRWDHVYQRRAGARSRGADHPHWCLCGVNRHRQIPARCDTAQRLLAAGAGRDSLAPSTRRLPACCS